MTDREPDLMAELDDAERIISGEVDNIVTEWGVRLEDGTLLTSYGDGGEVAARHLAATQHPPGMALVSRKVTYGAWQDA